MLRNKAATICQTVGEKTTLTEKPNQWTGHGFVGTTTGMKTNPVRSFLICVFFLLGDFFLLWWPRAWDSFCECFAGVVAFSSVVINDKKKVLFFLVSCLFGCLRHGQGHHDVDRIKKRKKLEGERKRRGADQVPLAARCQDGGGGGLSLVAPVCVLGCHWLFIVGHNVTFDRPPSRQRPTAAQDNGGEALEAEGACRRNKTAFSLQPKATSSLPQSHLMSLLDRL